MLAVVAFAAVTTGLAQVGNEPIAIGFVDVSTSQEANHQNGAAQLAPHLLVRFDQSGGGSGLVVTNDAGVAMVPLQIGYHCATVYGLDGRTVLLAKDSKEPRSRCIHVEKGKRYELGLMIAANQKYSTGVPPPEIE
jgi:hypothetical protein